MGWVNRPGRQPGTKRGKAVCGIAGLASIDSAALPGPEVVDAMCAMIIHRGPDDQGIYCAPRARIGMRRLSIIDLAGGHQPIHNEDRTVWVVFNGEIYNFAHLRADLEARGHRFYTSSDTECIAHAYEEYGDECFARLRGMFAIAILDTRRDRLVLARDRLGKKPLYYARTDSGWLAFASELKSLLAVPGFSPRPSIAAIRDYFTFGYVPAPAAAFEGVLKLLPAHYLVLEHGEVSTRRYWSLPFGPKLRDDEASLTEQLLGHLEDAVRVRLVSDVPFGAFLSGGVDSSVVAALMARNLSAPVKTFTIGFKEAAYNEMPDARLVARHIGAEHHELVVEANGTELLRDLVWYFDEPFGDSSSIPTFLVAKLAAGHVKMVLSGDGGDEGFVGYERYRRYVQLKSMRRMSLGLAAPLLRLASRVGGRHRIRLARVADRLDQPFPDRYLSGVAISTDADLSRVMGPGPDLFRNVRPHFLHPDITGEMDRVVAGDLVTYLADDILVKVDRMTMANSIEARAPLLDHQLLEFAARLPLEMKLRGSRGKYLLKQAARTLLPAECLNKRKQGFAIPLAEWFRGDLRSTLLDTMSDRRFRERGIFDRQGVDRNVREHLDGTRDHGEMLWLLMTYEMWARRFLDRQDFVAPVRAAGAALPRVANA